MKIDETVASLARDVAEKLDGRTLATAESCTAGRLSQLFAAAGGAQQWFLGGVVAYQTGIKRTLLGVRAASVLTEEAAEEMARGAAALLGADVGIATTGVVGDEAEDGVEPGTVFIATAVDGRVMSRAHRFEGDPPALVDEAAEQALRNLAVDLAAVTR